MSSDDEGESVQQQRPRAPDQSAVATLNEGIDRARSFLDSLPQPDAVGRPMNAQERNAYREMRGALREQLLDAQAASFSDKQELFADMQHKMESIRRLLAVRTREEQFLANATLIDNRYYFAGSYVRDIPEAAAVAFESDEGVALWRENPFRGGDRLTVPMVVGESGCGKSWALFRVPRGEVCIYLKSSDVASELGLLLTSGTVDGHDLNQAVSKAFAAAVRRTLGRDACALLDETAPLDVAVCVAVDEAGGAIPTAVVLVRARDGIRLELNKMFRTASFAMAGTGAELVGTHLGSEPCTTKEIPVSAKHDLFAVLLRAVTGDNTVRFLLANDALRSITRNRRAARAAFDHFKLCSLRPRMEGMLAGVPAEALDDVGPRMPLSGLRRDIAAGLCLHAAAYYKSQNGLNVATDKSLKPLRNEALAAVFFEAEDRADHSRTVKRCIVNFGMLVDAGDRASDEIKWSYRTRYRMSAAQATMLLMEYGAAPPPPFAFRDGHKLQCQAMHFFFAAFAALDSFPDPKKNCLPFLLALLGADAALLEKHEPTALPTKPSPSFVTIPPIGVTRDKSGTTFHSSLLSDVAESQLGDFQKTFVGGTTEKPPYADVVACIHGKIIFLIKTHDLAANAEPLSASTIRSDLLKLGFRMKGDASAFDNGDKHHRSLAAAVTADLCTVVCTTLCVPVFVVRFLSTLPADVKVTAICGGMEVSVLFLASDTGGLYPICQPQ